MVSAYHISILTLVYLNISGNDDLSLPKATVQKIITEILHNEPGVSFAKDTRDLLIECCVEFITLISSEANEIAENDSKKTIACEHVKAALEELGFKDYVQDILDVAADYKKQQAVSSPSNLNSLVSLLVALEPRKETEQNREKWSFRRAAHRNARTTVPVAYRQIQLRTGRLNSQAKFHLTIQLSYLFTNFNLAQAGFHAACVSLPCILIPALSFSSLSGV